MNKLGRPFGDGVLWQQKETETSICNNEFSQNMTSKS